jgi:hypothetical protein
VARRISIDGREVVERPDLLRVGGTWLEEVYFAFQFDAAGVRPALGMVVAHLRRAFDDESIADWLVRPNAELSSASPLAWLAAGGSEEPVTLAPGLRG